jgi:hypothetical protein
LGDTAITKALVGPDLIRAKAAFGEIDQEEAKPRIKSGATGVLLAGE